MPSLNYAYTVPVTGAITKIGVTRLSVASTSYKSVVMILSGYVPMPVSHVYFVHCLVVPS